MKHSYTVTPRDTLARIAGGRLPDGFGEPFLGAFKAMKRHSGEEELMSAALICSLFLSVILEGFPTARLNIFVRYTMDNCSRFTFDCKKYDVLFEKMHPESLCRVALLDKEGKACFRECQRQDIYEAFDFYTNR